MTLGDLSGDLRYGKILVSGLCFDSRKLNTGEVFFAIRGHASDGHQHLADVIKKLPAALVVENASLVPKDFRGPVITVANARAALDVWAAKFFVHPAAQLFCIGVTGTNGKTTSVYMLEKIFNQAGRLTGVLGTIDHHLGKKVWETALTTPDPLTLQSRLREFVDAGAKVAAFEVSSIAIDQNRTASVPFDAALFTNFTRDHLDYHGTMENYFAAKEKLFSKSLADSSKTRPYGVLNADDPAIVKIEKSKARYVWFGQNKGDYVFKVLSQDLSGGRFAVNGQTFEIATPGLHNIYNAVGALAVAHEAGVHWSDIQLALKEFSGAPGRLERVGGSRGPHVFVDYAHTDDALRSVLLSLKRLMRESDSNGQLWAVFGCGGDRDKGKRPLMAKAAVENADRVVLTSDNPRTEDPDQILRDCLAGIPNASVQVEADRKKAIAFALQTAQEDDVILIAGKGHENYQIIGQTKYPFSDVEVVREFLN